MTFHKKNFFFLFLYICLSDISSGLYRVFQNYLAEDIQNIFETSYISSGDNVIKLFMNVSYDFCNKLERLSLASFPCLV
jgi:hypothetical protein